MEKETGNKRSGLYLFIKQTCVKMLDDELKSMGKTYRFKPNVIRTTINDASKTAKFVSTRNIAASSIMCYSASSDE